MAFSENLAGRIRIILDKKGVSYVEKKMMGGLSFMVDDKMCTGVVEDSVMARIDPDTYEKALLKNGAREMDFTGRPMKGFVFVDEDGIRNDKDLEYWIDQCLEFNPRAKSSKKKK